MPPRPRVPGKLSLHLRDRKETPPGSGAFKAADRTGEWNVAETAIVICDMWDDGFCKISNQRVALMVPRMNEVISAARSHGAMIIHAPSATMNMYADTPNRRMMQQAKRAQPPVPLLTTCPLDTGKEPPWPVDTSKCGCDDPVVGTLVRRYNRQHAGWTSSAICTAMRQEMFNFHAGRIKNIVMMGISTNMCDGASAGNRLGNR